MKCPQCSCELSNNLDQCENCGVMFNPIRNGVAQRQAEPTISVKKPAGGLLNLSQLKDSVIHSKKNKPKNGTSAVKKGEQAKIVINNLRSGGEKKVSNEIIFLNQIIVILLFLLILVLQIADMFS